MIWAVWRAQLVLMPGTNQRFVPYVGFAIVLIGYSCFFAAIRAAADKRTMASVLAYGWGNAFVPLFPTIVIAEGAEEQR